MAKIKYVINPFSQNLLDAVNVETANEACQVSHGIGDTIEWELPDGSSIFSSHTIGAINTVTINGIPVEYPHTIGDATVCVAVPTVADAVENVIISGVECEVEAVVGDPCRIDPAIENKVLVESDNFNTNWPTGVYGLIIDKATTTECSVMLFGTTTVVAGLTSGLPVFLSADGELTQVSPDPIGSSICHQQIGYAFGTKLFVNPQKKTVRVP